MEDNSRCTKDQWQYLFFGMWSDYQIRIIQIPSCSLLCLSSCFRNMYKFFILIIISTSCCSCKHSESKTKSLDLANQYYNLLNGSSEINPDLLLSDSVFIVEKEDNYTDAFSKKSYIEWLQWDAVFDPNYKIFEIEQVGNMVKSKLSKIDKRLLFLHEEPMVWQEIIRFENNKIVKVERVKYEVFDVGKFLKKRSEFLSWMAKYYPEYKNFIYDQTENGGLKYLKAIDLYENRK